MNKKNKDILIVGAGPTGLTAAIELCRLGYKPEIIDKKEGPSPLSRAVGIAAHSLELLEASGVAEKLLSAGHKIRELRLHNMGKKIAALNFSVLDHRYNFLLALPQNQTEEIMAETLRECGVSVQYGQEFENLEINGDKVTAWVKGREEASYDMVIGADGIHSRVRKALGIEFVGYDYDGEWSIADFESADWPGEANLFFLEGGRVRFVIRIGENRYRAVANGKDALEDIPVKFSIDKTNRQDAFIISIRQATTYQKDPVYLAGDASHVHSPVGARGMNLGIEDACALVRRLDEGALDGYTRERHPIAKNWIAVSERISKSARMKNRLGASLRNALISFATKFAVSQRFLLKEVAGLVE